MNKKETTPKEKAPKKSPAPKKKLVIVESPAKANTIKKYLGQGYDVIASMGHIIDLPKSQLGVDVEHDFEPKYITIRGKGDLLAKLRKEAKASSEVFLATDPDREGEAISWHLAHALGVDAESNCRVTFNEITKNAVKNALKSPRAVDIDLVNAQQARRILDRIVGYKISPILWAKVKKGLSAGRVQSVATRLICDRDEEIEKFISKEYWSININLTEPTSKKTFDAKFYGINNKETELSNEEETNKVVKAVKGKPFVVKSVKKGEQKRNPAPPFITSTLQQEASRKLNFNAQRTMQVAQTLYEGVSVTGHGTIGLITYMRTDSLRIANEAQTEVIGYIDNTYGKAYVSPRQYKSKKNAQDAHEAIRPTSVYLVPDDIKASLTNDQYKLYKLIWSRFVASQMASAIFDVVSANIEANSHTFRASGSVMKFKGFTAVYVEGNDNQEEEKLKKLPELVEGQELKLNDIETKQHFTQPPPPYSEATLVKELEEKGIGRPSTYAPTISTIVARGYVVRRAKQLFPTELGKVTTDIMKSNFKDIVDVTFTANMENQLDEVEDGNRKWVEVLREFNTPFEETLKKAEEEIAKIEIKDEVSDVPCEKCGRLMVYKMGRFGKFLACPGYPECKNTKAIVEATGIKCPKCGDEIVARKAKNGNKYYACKKGVDCGFMTWDVPIEKEQCPKCGGLLLRKNSRWDKKTITCANEACDYKVEAKKEAKTTTKETSKKKKG